MTSRNRSALNEDIIAAAILMSTGTAVMIGRLNVVSSTLHLSGLNASAQWWWPLTLLISGVVLLGIRRTSLSRLRKTSERRAGAEGDRQ